MPIAIGATAKFLIFAHTLLESRVLDGGHSGEIVAHYEFRYQDGDTVRVPVRERFEIAALGKRSGGCRISL
jgi:hypothetical protein